MAVAHVAGMVAVKQEMPDIPGPSHYPTPHEADPVYLEERILTLCGENPKGITDDVIIQDQPLIDTERRLKALQRLLSQGKIDLLKQGSTLVYKLKTTGSTPSKTKGFEAEERLVYQIIEDSANQGIWIRDIRQRSNLLQNKVMKVLRSLESKMLIKSVKSVKASKKKVYMLYDLTPDESVTGGAWYSDQDFESEFVDVLNQHCLKFLQQKAFKSRASHTDPIARRTTALASAEEVCRFITELGISKVPLTAGNIDTILNTLLYDGRAEVVLVPSGTKGEGPQKLYRVTQPVLPCTGFNRIPCGVCPIINQCCDGGIISPSSCKYMKEWLQY